MKLYASGEDYLEAVLVLQRKQGIQGLLLLRLQAPHDDPWT